MCATEAPAKIDGPSMPQRPTAADRGGSGEQLGGKLAQRHAGRALVKRLDVLVGGGRCGVATSDDPQQDRGRAEANERREGLLPERQVEEPFQHDLDDDLLEERHQQPDANAQADRRAEDAREAAGGPERAEESHRRRGYRACWPTLRICGAAASGHCRRDPAPWGQTAGMADFENALADLAERLAGIAADMDDLGFEQLRAAASGGDPAHLDAERRLLKARRAIARAVAALRMPGDDDPTPL